MPSKRPQTKAPQAPFVSVVVPAYKTLGTIAETIDSILAQTYKSYEIIVVDDGSPDNVADFVFNNYGSAIKLIRQTNAGLAAARNTGIAAAKGRFVAFLDSDDVWLPQKLARQIESIEQHPDGAVFYTNCYFWENGKRTAQWIDQHQQKNGAIANDLINRRVMIPVLSTIVKREALQAVGGFDARLRQVEDYDLWLRLSTAGYTFYGLREPLALYRINPKGLSQNRLLMATTQLNVYKNLLSSTPSTFHKCIKEQINTFELEALSQKRKQAIAQHHRITAATLTLKMIPHRPKKMFSYLAIAVILVLSPTILRSKLV